MKQNKGLIIITVVALVTLIFVSSFSYYMGSQSKNDRLEACHKALNALNDITNDIDVSVSEAADNVSKCDPSFK